MVSIIVGFVLRYLPDGIKGIWNWFQGKQEDKQEEARLRLQLELDIKRAELIREGKKLDAELERQLAAIQADIEAMRSSMMDRKSARQYSAQINALMVSTLGKGKELGVYTWMLSIGWLGVLGIEMFGSVVQPAIAATVFSCWMYWKLSVTPFAWTVEDWMLLESVIGFYLAGRVQKWTNTKSV